MRIRGLESTLRFGFAVNDTSGSGDDGATPLCHVRLNGAAADAAPVLSPTPFLLTHATYEKGNYEVAVPATAANGFASGSEYTVFASITVDSQTPSAKIGEFRVVDTGDAPLTETGIAAAVEIDLSATHGAGSWLTGSCSYLGDGANVVTVTMLDDSGDPVPGILVVARNNSETTLVATGQTDADGVVELQLDDGVYKVRYGPGYAAGGAMARALGGGYGFTGNPYTLTVSGTTATSFACTVYSTVVGGLNFAELKGMVQAAIPRVYPEQSRFLLAGTLVSEWVNMAYQELDRKLRWSRAYVDLTTVADDEDYDFSVTVREVEMVEYQDASEDTVFELQPMDRREWLIKRGESTDSDTPTHYFRNGQVIYLYPVPDTAGDTVRLWSVMEPSDMVGDEEKPPFMAHLHGFIVDLAMANVMSHVGDFGMATQTRLYVDAQIEAERLEPAVKRSGPDHIIHTGSVL